MQPENIGTFSDLFQIYSSWGWMGAAAGAVWLFVKLWKSGTVDRWLGAMIPGLRFGSWVRWVRLLAVVILSFAAAILSGIATGKTLVQSIAAAVPVAMGAISWHEALQTLSKGRVESAGIQTAVPRPLR